MIEYTAYNVALVVGIIGMILSCIFSVLMFSLLVKDVLKDWNKKAKK